MHRNQSVNVHNFAMIPRADIPRSTFRIQTAHKTTFNASNLIPIFVDEILPGDTFKLKMTAFARLATPITPVMDNLYLDTFWFFVPNRLLWSNWKKFMGEQINPGDSISYIIPTITSPAAGFPALSIYDYMGVPTVGQTAAAKSQVINALPLRAYNAIYNEWFRDENLQNSRPINMGDGPDTYTDYALQVRGKRHDYFTSCLPWPQKGNTTVSIPLGTSAPVLSNNLPIKWSTSASGYAGSIYQLITSGSTTDQMTTTPPTVTAPVFTGGPAPLTFDNVSQQTGLYTDLSQATAATINQLRQSFQIQKLLERDARGGTRYTEIIRSHFGVISPDARQQRPEYLGGGSQLININPVAQTGGTGASGTTTPQGNLAAVGTALHRSGFHQSFTEHGYVIGLASVRADLNYQQGLRKLWSRSTRYDFYFPAFAMLGEQAVLRQEIYATGDPTNDQVVFGYQERWAEYRYHPTQITGYFRSTTAGTIDIWHYAEKFTSAPVLGATFISDPTSTTLQRSTAVGAAANGQQLIADMFFDIIAARPLPMYSVPGLIDHF